MENATKALIIIGAVLLALLILCTGVYLHGRLSQTSDEYIAKLDTIELQKYNKNFEIYKDREDLSAQDVITVVGIAKQKDNGTRVFMKNEDITDWSEDEKNSFLSSKILQEDKNDKILNLFKCTNIEYSNGKVTKITFEEIT